jgi:glycosyltransferase involved in cell wall biosynthesis
MRIGIDGGCLANRRGFGRFARQTLRALADAGAGGAHEFVVFVDRPSLGAVADAGAIPEGFETVAVDVTEAPSRAASSTGRRKLADLFAMARATARAGLDLMFFPASYSYFPVWNVGRVVVTMHDTLALAHPELVFPSWQGRVAWAVKEHIAARRADLVVTVSVAARRDLIAWFKLPEGRVRVVPESPDDVFGPRPAGPESDAALRRHGLDPSRRFFLYVGGLSPHKNLPRLIEAFARSGLAVEGVALALVGDLGDVFHTHVPELRGAVARLGLGDRVVFTGFVPDEDLVFLYNRAEALVQPSLLEGFGLPPVEAMACGTPVISSTAGSLPEVIGAAGLFFDPADVETLAGLLRRLADTPWLRADLAAKALQGARQFTREASARALLDAFEGLAPARPGLGPGLKAWRQSA